MPLDTRPLINTLWVCSLQWPRRNESSRRMDEVVLKNRPTPSQLIRREANPHLRPGFKIFNQVKEAVADSFRPSLRRFGTFFLRDFD
jgi:hypothetical protein